MTSRSEGAGKARNYFYSYNMNPIAINYDPTFWLLSVALPLAVSLIANILWHFLLSLFRRIAPQFWGILRIAARQDLKQYLPSRFTEHAASLSKSDIELMKALIGIILGITVGISVAWLSEADDTLFSKIGAAVVYGSMGVWFGLIAVCDPITTCLIIITLLTLPFDDPIGKMLAVIFLTPVIVVVVAALKEKFCMLTNGRRAPASTGRSAAPPGRG